MKSKILLLSCIFALSTLVAAVQPAFAQQPIVFGNSYKKKTVLFRGALMTDSLFRLPARDTVIPTWFPDAYEKGATVWNTADSLVYSFNGNKFVRQTPRTTLYGSAALNFPSMLTLTSADLTIAVAGAAVGDVVLLGPPAAPEAKLGYTAFVSATDTVTVRALNVNASTLDPASATFSVIVMKQ